MLHTAQKDAGRRRAAVFTPTSHVAFPQSAIQRCIADIAAAGETRPSSIPVSEHFSVWAAALSVTLDIRGFTA